MSTKGPNLHTLWGESKTLRAWARDNRSQCPVYGTLETRINSGWGLERALTTPPRTYKTTKSEAFGESKTLRQWAADSRCVVPYGTLYARVKARGWPLESAMTTLQNVRVSKFLTPAQDEPTVTEIP